jgi:archaetidylinositol phosphate synthase
VLDRLREGLASYLNIVGRIFARVSSSPTAWTFGSLVYSFLAFFAFATPSNLSQSVGGVLVLVSGWFDVVDGAVAKVAGRSSKRGAFLDSTLDRVGEVVVFAGILIGGHAPPLFVFAAITSSLLVSYTRAKGDSLGVSLSGVGVGERSERILVLAIPSLLGFTYWGVIAVALLATYTFLERTVRVATTLPAQQGLT